MSEPTLEQAGGIAYRQSLPPDWSGQGPAALALHGYPQSSYMWRAVLPEVAAAGYRALAPDLPGFGDSPPNLPGTWERQVEAVERFRQELGLERVALIVHDWGGLIGLRWACDHPDAVAALVISDTGFFSDGQWHALAATIRTPGEGEQLLGNMSADLFAHAIGQTSPGMTDQALAEYYKVFGDEDRRRCQLDLYRSGDFEKLEPYEGRLAALAVPALVLWGANDEFAPVSGAKRFERELPDARLVAIEDAGHFVVDDAPERYAAEVRAFLESL